ncbi:hypothetical protein BDK51DRAFT_39063 [Blyttiomyces helicus]|uniref:Uncharacterized protein n=1 Tax=Blyttiomyces helicus TaxID=388810 RepID=A0A4P9W6T9_9FUNG|nr:hypothetical protein BDK51DRAFT_39063 [Blyttiomyces helicus]|eukprot:RKO88054.1 hypothetical protein BDK51DRAFT_39063 [Blyttiomyces helicus]
MSGGSICTESKWLVAVLWALPPTSSTSKPTPQHRRTPTLPVKAATVGRVEELAKTLREGSPGGYVARAVLRVGQPGRAGGAFKFREDVVILVSTVQQVTAVDEVVDGADELIEEVDIASAGFCSHGCKDGLLDVGVRGAVFVGKGRVSRAVGGLAVEQNVDEPFETDVGELMDRGKDTGGKSLAPGAKWGTLRSGDHERRITKQSGSSHHLYLLRGKPGPAEICQDGCCGRILILSVGVERLEPSGRGGGFQQVSALAMDTFSTVPKPASEA